MYYSPRKYHGSSYGVPRHTWKHHGTMIGSHQCIASPVTVALLYLTFDSMWTCLITVPRFSNSPAGLTLVKLQPHLIQPDEPDQRVSPSRTLNHIWVKLLFNYLTLTRISFLLSIHNPSISMIVIIFSSFKLVNCLSPPLPRNSGIGTT